MKNLNARLEKLESQLNPSQLSIFFISEDPFTVNGEKMAKNEFENMKNRMEAVIIVEMSKRINFNRL